MSTSSPPASFPSPLIKEAPSSSYWPLPPAAVVVNLARLAAARAGQLVWMDAEEAAAYLNYPKATFDGLAGRGEVPRHKRGAGWRYHRDELDEWLLAG